jgi:thiol-disulfide isomerase/thioredoxin
VPAPKNKAALVAGLVGLGVAVAIAVAVYARTSHAREVEEAARRDEAAFEVDRSDLPAPVAAVLLSNGGSLALGQQKGQVLFVNFWATWCPPCRAEMPSMLQLGYELDQKYPGRFKMIAVSVDDGWPEVEAFFGGQLPPFVIVARDPEMIATRAYFCGARGKCPVLRDPATGKDVERFQFPETYLVDRQGRLTRYIIGPRDWSNPAARRVIERLIEG